MDKPEKLTRTVDREYLDVETGNLVRLRHEEPLKRRPAGRGKSPEPFGLWYPEGLAALNEMNLSANDWRVLNQLLIWTPFEEHTGYSATDLANKLGIHRNHISRSVRKLKALGVLIDGGGPRRVWINPRYFWRGSTAARNKVLHMLGAQKKSNATTSQTGDQDDRD